MCVLILCICIVWSITIIDIHRLISGLSSLRPSGSTPNNTPRRDPNGGAMSPTQASKSSTSLLFSSTSNYQRQRILADQLQRAMDSLNQQTAEQDISEDDEEEDDDDNRDDLDGVAPRESRHRLHIVEDDAATTLSMLDAYSSQLLHARTADNDSDSSDSLHHHHHHHGDEDRGRRSFHIEGEDSDEQTPSSSSAAARPYPGGGGSYVSMSVLDSIEALRRSRLLRGRVGEQNPIESDEEELETTADQSKLVCRLCFNSRLARQNESSCSY